MNVKDRILELCNQRNISINKLAEQSDITQSTLNSIMNNDDPNPQYKTIEKICRGLGVTMSDFYRQSNEIDNLRKEVLAEIEQMDGLTVKEKEAAYKIKNMPLDEQQKRFLKTFEKFKSLSASDQEALTKLINSLPPSRR